MAPVVVLDASIFAAFLLREPQGRKLDAVLAEVAEGRCAIWIPALFPFEMTNLLVQGQRQGRLSDHEVRQRMEEWRLVPMTSDPPPSPDVCRRIEQLARELGLSAYDASYVELAERIGADLLTLDKALLRLRKSRPWIG